jgi:hypothetical protein
MDRVQFLARFYPQMQLDLYWKHNMFTYKPKCCRVGLAAANATGHQRCSIKSNGHSDQRWVLDMCGPVRMRYARFMCTVHNQGCSMFDSECQQQLDLDLVSPSHWVLRRNNTFFTAEFLWFLVCQWKCFHHVDPVVDAVHKHWEGVWQHRVREAASIHSGMSRDVPYWKEALGLDVFTDRRTVIELLGDVYRTF